MHKQTESGILGVKADFRTRARNIHGDRALCIVHWWKNVKGKHDPNRRAPSGSSQNNLSSDKK